VAKKDKSKLKDARMTIWAHLAELRRRLFICIIAIGVAGVVGYMTAPYVLHFFLHFYRETIHNPNAKFVFTSPIDPFLLRLKVATYTAMLLASPVWLYQFWRFVTPALNPKEKKYALPFVASSIVLFLLGGVFALITIPEALSFLLGAAGGSLTPLLAADKFLGLVSLMILAFGVSFEFPVILVFLLLVRVLSTRKLRDSRKVAIVGVVAFAAVITPSQDPYSLFLMAVPMYIFYEASIVIGRLMKR
jgi:sec-independent protein translocase protein TatC